MNHDDIQGEFSSCRHTTTYGEDKENDHTCLTNAAIADYYAEKFVLGRWSILESRSELKVEWNITIKSGDKDDRVTQTHDTDSQYKW